MEQRIVTKPSFYTNIMLLSIPIILQQFLRVSVDLCDSIMLGRIDQVQMAAVSQAQQIFFVFYTVCNGFAVGCSVLIAQYWGLQRKEEIKTLFAIGSKIIAVFAIIISAIVLIRPDQVMRIYSSDPEVIALGASYLRIAAWMYTPCAVSSMLFACCRGIEQMKISFAVNAVSYPINLILDYCMIFGKFGFPELGIRGSAVGAVIARLIEFGILLWFIIRKEKTLQMRLKDFLRKDWKLTKDFLKVGIPIVAHEMIWSAGTTAGSSITGQMSTTIVAGYNVANAMYQLMACTMNGILHACSVTIGKTIGSGASRGLQSDPHRTCGRFRSWNADTSRRRSVHQLLFADRRNKGIRERIYRDLCGNLAILRNGNDRNDRSAPRGRRWKNGIYLRYLHYVDLHDPACGGRGIYVGFLPVCDHWNYQI